MLNVLIPFPYTFFFTSDGLCMTCVISFHLKILFHPIMGYLISAEVENHTSEAIKCINNLISTLLHAYRELKESIESPDGPQGNSFIF